MAREAGGMRMQHLRVCMATVLVDARFVFLGAHVD